MIEVRRAPHGHVERYSLDEFERGVHAGRIRPQDHLRVPAVTGDAFVVARELEMFRSLYAATPLTFRHHFHLGRIPWLTLGLIAALLAVYFGWQDGAPASTDALMQQGAKSWTLMVELGQWWRLLTANALHASGGHLAANAIFLLNLGGPAEAIFRRLDYALVLLVSALGASAASTLANPTVSCGASGMVFGVWAALAVFGVRHHDILPDRYRRYFIGAVVPYAIFALYLGFVVPGIDNWGHFGGLVAGASLAARAPSRLLAPRHRRLKLKLASIAALIAVTALASGRQPNAGALNAQRYYPNGGLAVPIPSGWPELAHSRSQSGESLTFGNRVGVAVGIETQRREQPIDLDSASTEFLENDLHHHVRAAAVRDIALGPEQSVAINARPAKQLRATLATPRRSVAMDFFVMARGHYRYVVTFSRPVWLKDAYAPLFAQVQRGIRWVPPDPLRMARRAQGANPTPHTHAALGKALAAAGAVGRAETVLRQATRKWPDNPEPLHALAQLLHTERRSGPEACRLATAVLRVSGWTPNATALAIDLYRACGAAKKARATLRRGLARFPDAPKLRARLAQESAP